MTLNALHPTKSSSKNHNPKKNEVIFGFFAALFALRTLSPDNGLSSRECRSTPNMTGRRFQRTMGVIPRRPWKSKGPFASRPYQNRHGQGDARGAQEVQHGTSSIHFLVGHRSSPFISVPEQSGRGNISGDWSLPTSTKMRYPLPCRALEVR